LLPAAAAVAAVSGCGAGMAPMRVERHAHVTVENDDDGCTLHGGRPSLAPGESRESGLSNEWNPLNWW
jgi:hypothetical protein